MCSSRIQSNSSSPSVPSFWPDQTVWSFSENSSKYPETIETISGTGWKFLNAPLLWAPLCDLWSVLCALCNITISLKGNNLLMLFDLWGMLITYLTIMTQNGNFNLTFEYFLSAGTTTKKIKSQKPEICVQETLSQFLDFNTLLYFFLCWYYLKGSFYWLS